MVHQVWTVDSLVMVEPSGSHRKNSRLSEQPSRNGIGGARRFVAEFRPESFEPILRIPGGEAMALKIRWLDQALAANKGVGPGFHFLRHALAIVILAHHCRVAVFGLGLNAGVAGYVKGAPFYRQLAAHLSPGLLFIELSRPALFALVGVFFALSGFLVYGSATRSRNIGSFFANRALRLLPALTVEVFLSGLILRAFGDRASARDIFSANLSFFVISATLSEKSLSRCLACSCAIHGRIWSTRTSGPFRRNSVAISSCWR